MLTTFILPPPENGRPKKKPSVGARRRESAPRRKTIRGVAAGRPEAVCKAAGQDEEVTI